MLFLQGTRNQLRRCFSKRDFSQHGLKAEFAGSDSIRISRKGKYLGQLRKKIGAYCWYPDGLGKPQFRSFSPDKALNSLVASVGRAP